VQPDERAIVGPTVWAGDTVPDARATWTVPADALVAAGARGDVRGTGGLDLADPAPAPLVDAVRPAAAALAGELGRGPGFVRTELPLAELGEAGMARVLVALLAAWGRPVVQNLAGDLLYEVRDRVGSASQEHGSRGAGDLLPHTDQAAAAPERLPDLLVMAVLSRAAEGGATRLLSGHEAHNRLLDRHPAGVDVLSEPMWFARSADGTADDPPMRAPVFAGRGRATRVRYNRFFLRLGGDEAGVALTGGQRVALDELDAVLDDDELAHETVLEPGELLLIDNHVVLHDRTPFVDAPPDVRRLLRGWVRTT
jgi:hypothetical protein